MLLAARQSISVASSGVPSIYIPARQFFNISRDLLGGAQNENWIGYSFDITVRILTSAPSGNDYTYGILGPAGINVWNKYFGIYGRFATWFKAPDTGINISQYVYDGEFHDIHIERNLVIIDGTSHTFTGGSWTTSGYWSGFGIGSPNNNVQKLHIRSCSGYDSSRNVIFSLSPTKDSNGNGAFKDSVTGTTLSAAYTDRDMHVYVVE